VDLTRIVSQESVTCFASVAQRALAEQQFCRRDENDVKHLHTEATDHRENPPFLAIRVPARASDVPVDSSGEL